MAEIADVVRPPGRYRTLYVQDESFGLKLLSGRQIAQYKPIAMKIMSRGAWDNPEEYLVLPNMIVLAADGRAEENLADCAMIRDDRAGHAASGHVIRLVPKPNVSAGSIYLASACKIVQSLFKSLATGSVVDALSKRDVEKTIVLHPNDEQGRALSKRAISAWDLFAEANLAEKRATDALDEEFS